MNKPLYKWRVTHPAHGTAEVVASDRLAAMTAAAHVWGVPWTPIARECAFERIEVVAVE